MLGGSERIDLHAPVCQFPAGHLVVDFGRDAAEHPPGFPGDGGPVVGQIPCAQCLDCKGHVHDFGGMAVACGQVDQPAFRDYVDGPAVFKGIGGDIVPRRFFRHGHFPEIGN